MEITTVASSDRATAISFTLVSGDGKKRERSLKIFSQRVLLKLTYSKLSIFYKRLKLHILRSKALFAFPLTVTFNWYLETEYRQSSVRLSGPVFILCVLTLSQNYRYTISVTFHSKVTILAKRQFVLSYHISVGFLFQYFLPVYNNFARLQNKIETLLKCQEPSSWEKKNPLLIWGHQLGKNLQTKNYIQQQVKNLQLSNYGICSKKYIYIQKSRGTEATACAAII